MLPYWAHKLVTDNFWTVLRLTVFRWAPPTSILLPPRPNGEALRRIFWETSVSPPLAQEKGTPWWGGGGGRAVQKRLKRHKFIFFSKKGAGTGSTRLWLEGGGACSTGFIIGPLQWFYMAHVVQSLHIICNSCGGAITVADLGGGGGWGVRTNPLYFSNPLLNYPILIQVYTLIVASEFEPSQNSDPPSHNSGSAPVSVKASDQCLIGRWFESTPRQPSLTHACTYVENHFSI